MKAREIALLTLQETDTQAKKSEQSLHRLLNRHKPDKNDRSLATELVNGVLRYRLRLDFIISLYYHHDLKKAAPVLRNILRLGAYQLLFLNKIPGWAAVNECVSLAVKYKGRHIAGIVNGVLRRIASWEGSLDEILKNEPLERRLSLEYSHPEWLVQRWVKLYGEEQTVTMLSSNNRAPLLSLRVNSLKTTPETMEKALKDAAVTFTKAAPEQFILTHDFNTCEPFIHLGLVTVQNPTQAIPCLLLDPMPGDTILDLCSSPGGKATFMAELMKNKGSVLAVDRYRNKCEKVMRRAQALGISIIETITDNAETFQPDKQLSAILLDAPCTGTGVLGKKPDLRWRITPQKLDELGLLQSKLLDHAAGLLNPGGVLVYATCSIEPEENQLQIDRFLERHPDFSRDHSPVPLPVMFSEMPSTPGAFITLPGKHEGYDGGFAQRLLKNNR